MANIALLVPDESMLRQAHDALQEMKASLHIMRVIRTVEAVSEARRAANEGAEIIIARGIQATLIRQYTDLPVVEIVMTERSAEELVRRAKRISGRDRPVIAFVMLRNMACSMAGIAEKLGVDLREYYVQNMEMLRGSAEQAVADGADVLIGGAMVLETADRAGVSSLFLNTDEDAMANAIREAERLGRTLEGEEEGTSGGGSAPGAAEEPFVNFPYRSRRMRECVDLAAALALSDCPKLIVEEAGTLRKAFAIAVHNHSRRAGERLQEYTCVRGMASYEDLFGRKGLFMEAGKGTVLLNDIENLDALSLRKLSEILRFRHVIAATSCPAPQEMLPPELWYRLNAFLIRIPPLRETPEDIEMLSDYYLKSISEKYGRFHSLEKAAREYLTEQDWPGNRVQLESFLERLVITADRRILRKDRVEQLYVELYGKPCGQTYGKPYGKVLYPAAQGPEGWEGGSRPNAEKPGNCGNCGKEEVEPPEGVSDAQLRERERILEVLTRNLGNREKTAEQLGISTTTLWRKLKKLRIL